MLEAYERLILDAMRGDHTLFTTAEGIESLWERSQPLLDDPPPVKPYPPGTWGPNAIHQLIAPQRLAAAVRAGVAREEVRTERQAAAWKGLDSRSRASSGRSSRNAVATAAPQTASARPRSVLTERASPNR